MTKFQADLAELIEGKGDDECVEVPVGLLRAMVVDDGEKLLTTQQVADALGVSRPFVVKLIDGGQLPAQLVGTHRRVRADELARWKAENKRKRLQTLNELAALDRELTLDDNQTSTARKATIDPQFQKAQAAMDELVALTEEMGLYDHQP